MTRAWAWVVLFVMLASSGYAQTAVFTPTPGNQFVTVTDKYLYVVWSVPQNLAPFAGIQRPDQLETFVERTAIALCNMHAHREPSRTKQCKVQVVRLNSNDEYTKSAAGGFKTVATLVAPLSKVTSALISQLSTIDAAALRAVFERIKFVHEDLPLGRTP